MLFYLKVMFFYLIFMKFVKYCKCLYKFIIDLFKMNYVIFNRFMWVLFSKFIFSDKELNMKI